MRTFSWILVSVFVALLAVVFFLVSPARIGAAWQDVVSRPRDETTSLPVVAEAVGASSPVTIVSAQAPFSLQLVPVVARLEQPLFLTHAGDGSGRLFIVEQGGKIRVVVDDKLQEQPFFDATSLLGAVGGEQGLLGMAFHPRFQDNGWFFIAYTDKQKRDAVARVRVTPRATTSSVEVLLAIDDPAGNHNGGMLAFGPDGLLYIGTGDGGAAGDPWGNGQNPTALLGKMLRLDVNRAGARPEIWAIGLRNPWRYSFDRETGDLWIADVGQNTWEEIDFVERRALSTSGAPKLNFGWNVLEGRHCFQPRSGCDATGKTMPIFEYRHGDDGCSVTGGYVYRGKRQPKLVGHYLFADYCSGKIWTAWRDREGRFHVAFVQKTTTRPSSFGEDEAGELYLVDHGGQVLRLAVTP